MFVFKSLSESQQDLIKQHLDLVIQMNKNINLTKIDNRDEAMILHVEDSLLGMQALNEAPQGLYGDIGTGAGYPGIPLSIATGRKTVLIDARKKKADALKEMIKSLGLENQVSAVAGRAELIARTQAGQYSALTARALSKLSVLLELASPLLSADGVLICYKAMLDESELADARRVCNLVGMCLEDDQSIMLNGEYQRRILVFRKFAEPKVKLPRLEGQAQKNPL